MFRKNKHASDQVTCIVTSAFYYAMKNILCTMIWLLFLSQTKLSFCCHHFNVIITMITKQLESSFTWNKCNTVDFISNRRNSYTNIPEMSPYLSLCCLSQNCMSNIFFSANFLRNKQNTRQRGVNAIHSSAVLTSVTHSAPLCRKTA